MSDSHEQSLNENAVFLPVDESCPEFLHCEREREAVERLLSAGPEAFYSCIDTERSGCFLSSEEVSQISSWAQNYDFNQLQQQNAVESSSDVEDFCSTYFPCHSDMPTPNLELGWPEKNPWVPQGSVTIHTSPPADGQPPVREVIRRHLQKASQVIAIVTDRLTDGAIIGDLHNAASRGVPVYIILNQRSIQENFTLNRLRHPSKEFLQDMSGCSTSINPNGSGTATVIEEDAIMVWRDLYLDIHGSQIMYSSILALSNMQVRVLRGTSFCSRTGRMVVGEMKNKFLLVDLETVIHGSYSLTWTDAHLHRHLITVLSGPVVEAFDREFRILFAASLPIPNTWRVTGTNAHAPPQLKNFPPLRFQKQVSLEPEIFSPPSPPADFLMDWEAMGVVQRDGSFLGSSLGQHEEIEDKEMPLQNNMLFDKNTPKMDGLTYNVKQFVDKRRFWENTSPVTTGPPDASAVFNNKEPLSTDRAATERLKRMEHKIETAISRQLSMEKKTNLHDRNATRLNDEATESTHILPSAKKGGRLRRRESILEEDSITEELISKVETTPSSRKPIILRVPQSESFSSLSDIMKRIKQGTSVRSNSTLSERTQSMMNLSIHDTDTNQDERGVPVPRFKASYEPDYMTPALALMRKRNDELKSTLYRTPKPLLPRERPRSSSYTLHMDWRRPLAEKEGEQA